MDPKLKEALIVIMANQETILAIILPTEPGTTRNLAIGAIEETSRCIKELS